MTDEQLLELPTTLGIVTETLTDKHGYDFDAYVLSSEQLLKFARAIIEEHETTREHNLSKDEYFNSWRY